MLHRSFWFVCLLFLSVGCGGAQPRTYYDSLALETPETAVETFIAAYQARDFPTVYLIFAPWTQVTTGQQVNLFQHSLLIDLDPKDVDIVLEDTPFLSLELSEHRTGSYLFDAVMLAGVEHERLYFDFHGKPEIISVIESPEEEGTDVRIHLPNNPEQQEFTFRMEQAPSGKWRVRQVILPGGDESQIPWSIP